MVKKVFKGWLPKNADEYIQSAKTVESVAHYLTEASSSPDKTWFETNELPPRRVTVTVEVED